MSEQTQAVPVFRHRAKDEGEDHTKCVACGYWFPCPEYVLKFGGEPGTPPPGEQEEIRDNLTCSDLDHSTFVEAARATVGFQPPYMWCWQCGAEFVPNSRLEHRKVWSVAVKKYRCVCCMIEWPCEPVVYQDLMAEWERTRTKDDVVNHPHPDGPVWVLLGWDENAPQDEPALFIAEFTTDPEEADILMGEAATGEFWFSELPVESIEDDGFYNE